MYRTPIAFAMTSSTAVAQLAKSTRAEAAITAAMAAARAALLPGAFAFTGRLLVNDKACHFAVVCSTPWGGLYLRCVEFLIKHYQNYYGGVELRADLHLDLPLSLVSHSEPPQPAPHPGAFNLQLRTGGSITIEAQGDELTQTQETPPTPPADASADAAASAQSFRDALR